MVSDCVGKSFLPLVNTTNLNDVSGLYVNYGGACALNNYYDQDIDSIMPSKQQRPTVNERISNRNLLILNFGMMLIGEALLFALNIPSGVIGLLGIVGYVSFYSIWSKRHTVWNTVIGSFPGAVPPLIGWTAIEGNISLVAVALFLVIFCWQPIHFYALAIKRKDEYSLANIPMLPSVKGFNRTRVSMFFWLVVLLPLPFLLSSLGVTFIVLATLLNLGWLYLGLTSFKRYRSNKMGNKNVYIFTKLFSRFLRTRCCHLAHSNVLITYDKDVLYELTNFTHNQYKLYCN